MMLVSIRGEEMQVFFCLYVTVRSVMDHFWHVLGLCKYICMLSVLLYPKLSEYKLCCGDMK